MPVSLFPENKTTIAAASGSATPWKQGGYWCLQVCVDPSALLI
jgi:hypothetical protein